MNRQITKLAVASLILLAALIVATTYSQRWASASLAEKQDNAIQRVAQFRIKRGLIRAADGTVLATNVRRKVGGQTLYFRRYPTGRLFANLVGYSTQARSRAGLEQSENAYLTASNANLGTIFNKTLDKLKGVTITGNDLILSARPRIQRLAMQQLAGKCGAAVVMNPRTGKVYALASQPTYDPNLVENHFNQIKAPGAPCRPAAPLLNRATDGLFTPGSTFKVVTATAALDSHKFTPESTFYDPGYCVEYGKHVSNAASPDGPVESFGHPTLAMGLQHSINSVFCNVGKALGAGTILEYMKRFGFYKDPPLETPANEKVPSGLYHSGRLFFPRNPATQVDPGRLAFGQETLAVTPLQMAMVASTVANGGVAMDPGARPRRRPRRQDHRPRPPERAEARDVQADGQRDHLDDGRGGQRRHRRRCRDPRDLGRGQDGYRGNGHLRDQHDLVHLLRAGREPEGRGRGHAREPDRVRRHHRSADRQAADAGGPQPEVEQIEPWR